MVARVPPLRRRGAALRPRLLARELPVRLLPPASAAPLRLSASSLAMASESIESYLKEVIQPLTTDLATDMLPIMPEAG